MNAKQWISLMCYVVFEETTHKRRLGSKSFFLFQYDGVDDGDLSAGNNGNAIKATLTALTASTSLIVSSIYSASM